MPPALVRLFGEGFRLFHLAAGLFAVLAVAVWGLWLAVGQAPGALPTAATPPLWHAHEMVFGYGGAVLAGLFLTAPSGRLPHLFFPVLGVLWLAGRLAIWGSAYMPAIAVAAVDLAFLIPVWARMAGQFARRPRWQTGMFLAVLTLHWVANLAVHLDWMGLAPGVAGRGVLAGLLVCAVMNAVFGGRMTSGLTRNAMVRAGARPLPADRPWLDALGAGSVLAAAGLALTGAPPMVLGAVYLAAGAAQSLRLAGWRGLWAGRQPLLASFHLAFAFLSVGLLAMGLAEFGLGGRLAALHLLAIGAVAGMSLAVMARGVLGQTGRAPMAPSFLVFAYAAVALSATLRWAGGEALAPQLGAAFLFAAGFAAYVAALWPAFLGPKLRPGSPGARPLGH